MNIKNILVALMLIPVGTTELAMAVTQPSKGMVEEVKPLYKTFINDVKCMLSRTKKCTPEQRRRIRRGGMALIGITAALGLGTTAGVWAYGKRNKNELDKQLKEEVTFGVPWITADRSFFSPQRQTHQNVFEGNDLLFEVEFKGMAVDPMQITTIRNIKKSMPFSKVKSILEKIGVDTDEYDFQVRSKSSHSDDYLGTTGNRDFYFLDHNEIKHIDVISKTNR